MESSTTKDTQDLAALGYKQHLARPLGAFSAFAASFSYLSILTGTFQLFYFGFGKSGPAFWWTWPITFVGQLLVALCFAEVASHFPLAGGVYQWSKFVGSSAVGWMTGWICLGCQIVTVAAVALAIQITLPQIDPRLQILSADAEQPSSVGTSVAEGHDEQGEADRVKQIKAKNAVLLGCVVIAFTTIVNVVGVRVLALINNVGVFAEFFGAVFLIVLLAVHAQRGPEVLLRTNNAGADHPAGYFGSFLAAALMAAYVMYGFENAGLLAEETKNPRKTAPRAILRALITVALLGGLLLLFAMMATGNLQDPRLGDEDGGLPLIVKEVLGDGLGNIFLWDVILAITVCALTVHTGAVRLMFGMARDNQLPLSRMLARVSVRSKIPMVPAVITGVLAALILVVNFNERRIIDAVIPVAIMWANLAYLCVTAPLLIHRLRGWPRLGGHRHPEIFTLGRWGLPVNILAVLWGAFVIINIGWPRPEGTETWYEANAAWLGTGTLIGAGAAYYLLFQRRNTGILKEHCA
jgi:urea carboxylase system permease